MEAIADKKGSDVVMLDVRPISILADYFVIGSGESERQIGAIVDEVITRAKTSGGTYLQVEGEATSGWVLVDCGSVIVHVFTPSQRDYYRLERLWSDAPIVVRIQ